MFDLENKVCVITGASSGLGRQMVFAYAKKKCKLVLIARRKEILDEIKSQLDTDVLTIKCDVTDTLQVEQAYKLVEDKFGKVDILVNCAGASRNNNVFDMTDEEWGFTIDTDLTSVFKMTRVFAQLMKKNNYGRIINIASIYGLVGNSKIPTIAYHASKGGVVNLTRALASELAKYNICVNAICPGYFYTELTKDVLDTEDFQDYAKVHVPMQRYGKEGELNGLAILLGSDEASYITGAIIPVDGGYTCV